MGGGCLHNFLELLFIVEHKAFSELSLMVSRTVFSVELLWRCWRDGSLMKRSSTTRVALLATSLFFLSCLLTLILSPTEKFVPTLSAILGSKDLNVSMNTTPVGSTSLSLWFSNRWLWLRQCLVMCVSDSPEKRWQTCQSLAEYSSPMPWEFFLWADVPTVLHFQRPAPPANKEFKILIWRHGEKLARRLCHWNPNNNI